MSETGASTGTQRRPRWRRWLRRGAVGLVAAIALLLGLLVVRATGLESRQPEVAAVVVALPAADQLAAHLAGALRFATVSSADGPVDPAAFVGLHDYLERTYPRVHAGLRREVIGGYSLLYTWVGREPALPAVVLLAHLDVVPAEVTAAAAWQQPPFSGVIEGGFVWGRGALDDKIAVVAILEAAEHLVAAGFTPRRTIIFAFGHDEEVGGREGAARIAASLADRGIQAALVLDEGLAITEGILDGLAAPVAMIGIAEKGIVDVGLTVAATGGHAAMPPPATPVGILGRALAAIEDHPMPSRLAGVALETFGFLAPEMGFGRRVLMANLWLLAPLVERALAGKPASNALIRTTIAPTMLVASDRSNVLPAEARATLNVRLLPGDRVADVVAHLRGVVGDDRVTIAAVGPELSPSRLSPVDDPTFVELMTTIREVAPSAIVAPGLVVGTTDSKHYAGLGDHIYRFNPIRIGPADLPRLHGVDERIAVADLPLAVSFFVRLLERFAG